VSSLGGFMVFLWWLFRRNDFYDCMPRRAWIRL